MAVYFDHRLETDQAGISTDLKWFSGTPLLSVTSYSDENGGAVSLYTEEGEKLANSQLQKNCHVTAVAWHPKQKVVAVGWESGELLIWNQHDRTLHEAVHMHKSAISVIHWSSNGSRVASGDKSGILIVWKADMKGRLGQNPQCQHHIQEPLTQIVSRPAPPPDPAQDIASLARAAVSGDENALDMFNWKRGKNAKAPSVFGGTVESLSFFVAGASGQASEVFSSEKSACTLRPLAVVPVFCLAVPITIHLPSASLCRHVIMLLMPSLFPCYTRIEVISFPKPV